MRLLNCHTLELKEYTGNDIPPYFILSHRWGDGEVSYKDFRKGRDKSSTGYKKIVDFCAFARARETQLSGRRDAQWVWADTCCIDKRSSAELTEAINSMFGWYRTTQVCVVHLDDVPPLSAGLDTVMAAFCDSLWYEE